MKTKNVALHKRRRETHGSGQKGTSGIAHCDAKKEDCLHSNLCFARLQQKVTTEYNLATTKIGSWLYFVGNKPAKELLLRHKRLTGKSCNLRTNLESCLSYNATWIRREKKITLFAFKKDV